MLHFFPRLLLDLDVDSPRLFHRRAFKPTVKGFEHLLFHRRCGVLDYTIYHSWTEPLLVFLEERHDKLLCVTVQVVSEVPRVEGITML